MAETSLWVPLGPPTPESEPYVQPAREAIRNQHKMRIRYSDEHGSGSDRTVWPFALAYFEGRRLLAAWCELRSAIRHFRIDRIQAASTTGERYPGPRQALLKTWRELYGIREDS
jgi:predicted DNA-binding transcriptional regulator YafY